MILNTADPSVPLVLPHRRKSVTITQYEQGLHRSKEQVKERVSEEAEKRKKEYSEQTKTKKLTDKGFMSIDEIEKEGEENNEE